MTHLKRIFLIAVIWMPAGLQSQTQFPWPVTPFDQSHLITGNFAEYRSTSVNGHFHNGTDIPKPDGSPVYPSRNGNVTAIVHNGSNSYVSVNDLAYVHIEPNPSLSVGSPVVTSQTILGTILSGLGHVHLTNNTGGVNRNSMLPNSGLTPLDDPWPPIIRFVRFYQNNSDNQFSTNNLSGPVDIIVKVDEQNGPPGSSTAARNNGTYKIGYRVFSADTATVVYEPPNGGVRFQFDTKPSSSVVNTVFYRPLSNTSSHTYQITNSVSGDNFWNTAAHPPGDYVVMVFTEDTRGNSDVVYTAVTVDSTDVTPPQPPVLRGVSEVPTGMQVQWFSSPEADLLGYRLYFSFDNSSWSLFKGEANLTAQVTDTTITQVLNRDVYFRLTAVDDAAVPNQSAYSDIYGMSNGNFAHKVLIVDGFDRTSGGWPLPYHDMVTYYSQALKDLDIAFDSAPNEALVDSTFAMNNYDAVIWFCGDEAEVDETFSNDEQALLAGYLENGGSLFVSGARIGWDLSVSDSALAEDQQFLTSSLKANYQGNVTPGTVTGRNASIFDGLSFSFGAFPYAIDSADVLGVQDGSVECLTYADGGTAGIQYSGSFGGAQSGKLVYLAFPFETIPDADRDAALARVMDFFFDLTAIAADEPGEHSVPAQFALLGNDPNPFNPNTVIRYQLPVVSHVTLSIYNLLGQKMVTLVEARQPAGIRAARWDGRDKNGSSLASGVYIAHLQATSIDGNKHFGKSHKLLLMK